MKEILVVSGKGGTGKTSISASLAALMKNSVLADCDVDAADLHLVLTPDIKSTNEFISGHEAIINKDKCIKCGKCKDACRFDAIKIDNDGNYKIDPIACEGCGVCKLVCPSDAVEFNDALCGHIYDSETRFGPMIHSKLSVTAENSGKLVSEVRRLAKNKALEYNIDTILIDGPPGIGCPVIASVTGTDYVLVVTEPSLSAMHDMERVISLCRHFGAKIFVCINKCDINEKLTKEIKDNMKNMNIEVIGEIPYDKSVTKAQIAKMSIVEYDDTKASIEIRKMYSRLEQLINDESNLKN